MNPGDKVICVNSDGLHGPAAHPIRGLRYTICEVRFGAWPSVSLEEIPFAFWNLDRFTLSPRSTEQSQTSSVQSSSYKAPESATAEEAGENL